MSGDRCILLVVGSEREPVRRLVLSRRLLRIARGALLGTTVLLVLAAAVAVKRWYDQVQIQAANSVLVDELHSARDRVADLEGEVTRLTERGRLLRVLAGLEPLERDVLQVGVGGPGLPRLEDVPFSDGAPGLAELGFIVRYDLNALERRTRLLAESLSEAADTLQLRRERLLSTPSILPARGRLTSGFQSGRVHPIRQDSLPHTGIDIAAPRGTPIRAAAAGEVVAAGRRAGYGLSVELDHGFGYRTRYAHLARIHVQEGDRVERGNLLGSVGSTGLATAPHLHYEVRLEGRPEDPLRYVQEGAP